MNRKRAFQRHRRRGVAVALAIGLLASACSSNGGGETVSDDDGGGENGGAPPAERQTLQYGISVSDIGLLDPHRATAGQDRTIVHTMFNGLVRLNPSDFREVEPDLAEEVPEPTIDGDGQQVWDFTLREGVMCHEGPETEAYELTAEDVVYSLERAADPERSSNAPQYLNVVSFEATGPYEVRITLAEPQSDVIFLHTVADYGGGYIVCQQAVEAQGDDGFNTHPVGTGAFAYSQYLSGQSLGVVANDDYFRGEPGLAGIDFVFMPNPSSRELALQNGDLDLITGEVDQAWIDRLDGTEGLNATSTPFGGAMIFFFNTEFEPLDDIRVRQAISMAIDNSAHQALGGEQVMLPAFSVGVPEMGPGGLTEDDAVAAGVAPVYDPEAARALLAEAGYPDGFDLQLSASEVGQFVRNYEVLQAELADVGVDITLQSVDHSTYETAIREGANAITFMSIPRLNHDQALMQYFHGDSIVVGGANPVSNFTFWSGADDLIEEARRETDPEQQQQLWQEAYVQIAEEVVAHPAYVTSLVGAWRDEFSFGRELTTEVRSYYAVDETATLE